MSFLSGAGKFFRGAAGIFVNPAISLAVNSFDIAGRVFGSLLGSLIKIPKADTGVDQGGQTNNINARQNISRINDCQPVFYGRVRRWPELKSAPWIEYINDKQVLHQLMQLGVGICSVEDNLVGATPSSSYAGFASQVCLPGSPESLFHANVYTSEEASDIDLEGGALEQIVQTGSFEFAPVGHIRRIEKSGAFARVRIGTDVLVVSPSNAGSYTVTAQNSNWIDVDVDLVAETADATVTIERYNDDGDSVIAEDVAAVFSATGSSIAGPEGSLSVFRYGDVITPTGGANKDVLFTVISAAELGNELIVTPAPTAASATVDLVLMRRYAGPFYACPPGAVVDRIAVDFIFPQGLAKFNGDGDPGNRAVVFEVQHQAVDNSGVPSGSRTSTGQTSIAGKSRDPVRRTVYFDIDPPCRAQVWNGRVSIKSNSSKITDIAQWGGLKGFIKAPDGEDHRVFPDATILAQTLTASGQLASGSDKKINNMLQRWLETYDPEAEAWTEEQPTSAIVWAALDLMRGRYTAKDAPIADDMIDLPAFLAAHEVFEAAGRKFNGSFDQDGNWWDALGSILRCGRAEPRRNFLTGVYSLFIDAPRAPVQMFSDNNAECGVTLRSRTSDSASGIVLEYTDPITWEAKTLTIGDPLTRPREVKFLGCTDRQQAWEDLNYQWNELRYRNRDASLSVECEALLLNYGDVVLCQSRACNWGWGGLVIDQDGDTLTMHPAPTWQDGAQHFVYLRDAEGRPGAKINCSRGTSDAEIVLDDPADVAIALDETHIIFGCPGNEPQLVLVKGMGWSGMRNAEIEGVVDDVRVHAHPGPAPVDPDDDGSTAPDLAITGLTAAMNIWWPGVVSASWDAVTDAILYETQWDDGSGIWRTGTRGTATAVDFSTDGGDVTVRVRTYGPAGRIGSWTTFVIP